MEPNTGVSDGEEEGKGGGNVPQSCVSDGEEEGRGGGGKCSTVMHVFGKILYPRKLPGPARYTVMNESRTS